MTEKNSCKSCGWTLPDDAPGGLCPVCVLRAAAEPPPAIAGPSLEEIRRAFPQLEILECIGRGGMGIVYKAWQPHLGRHVALKLLDSDLHANPDFAERFAREARFLGKLAHPNIVAIHDFGETAGFFWLMMEYVDGVNLRQAMQAGRFSPAQALAIIPEICTALQFAHNHGVLHRDIKPENILLDAKGHVKIADFGIARLLDTGHDFALTHTGSALGSAAYIAPEQIESPHDVDHRADIYSLGVVFYEMLTGELPLGRFPAPSEKSASDPRLDEVVFRALAKEREKRYQSADGLRTGVEKSESAPPVGKGTSPTNTTGLPWSVKVALIGVGGGFLMMAFLLFSLPENHRYYFSLSRKLFNPPIISRVSEGTGMFYDLWFNLALGLMVVGFGTGLRALYRIKKGRQSPVGWNHLRCFILWPLLLAVVGRIAAAAVQAAFPDVLYQSRPQALVLAGLLLAFVLAVVIARLLRRLIILPTAPPPRRARNLTLALGGILTLLATLLIGKHLSVQLPALSQYSGRTFQIYQLRGSQPLDDRDTAMVKQAVITAAGDYADLYRFTYSPFFRTPHGTSYPPWAGMSLDFLCQNPQLAEKHLQNFQQRLRALLPWRINIAVSDDYLDPWRTPKSPLFHGIPRPATHKLASWREENVRSLAGRIQRTFRVPLLILFGLATLLTAFVSKRWLYITLGIGLVAGCGLAALRSWPVPDMLPPAIGTRPPLPSLAVPEYDFTTVPRAMNSLLKAARLGDAPHFMQAFSPKEIDGNTLGKLPLGMPGLVKYAYSGRFFYRDDGGYTSYNENPEYDFIKGEKSPETTAHAFIRKDNKTVPTTVDARRVSVELTWVDDAWRITSGDILTLLCNPPGGSPPAESAVESP